MASFAFLIFIPQTGLVQANIQRLFTSAAKMFKIFLRSPIRSRSMLPKAWKTVKPALRQAFLSGYVFAFQLPMPLVNYLGTGGNRAWLRGIHANAHGNRETYTGEEAAEAMASTLGPSVEEYNTETSDHLTYSPSVLKDGGLGNWAHSISYYRHNTATARWSKSIETIASLHAISRGNEIRRTGSRAGVFDEGPKGSLKAESTFVWGLNDIALDRRICLEGIDDYLTHRSQVVTLPHSGHFTPVESESRKILEEVIMWASRGEKEDITAALKAYGPSAKITLQT
jgi:pimeloyl-ACP methyl ester carboxylesterase